MMKAKQTALDAYLARTAAIRAKLERLQGVVSENGKNRTLRPRDQT
jgi:hypothetical protein